MPEDFKTFVARLYQHAKKQLELMEKAIEAEEYDTVDFLAQVTVVDLTKLREVVNARLNFSRRQG